MRSRTSNLWDQIWFFGAASVLFLISLSPRVEELTSPHALWSHVFLRKFYSVVAFAIVGYLEARVVRATSTSDVLRAGVTVGLYSATIEIAQKIVGSHEGIRWNAADTVMGALGGLIGSSFYLWTCRATRVNERKLPVSERAG
jgi:hypothetical protein